MLELKQYELDFETALNYLKDNLQETNTLSSQLIELVDFRWGRFFTVLPSTVDLKKINEFRSGGIAQGVKSWTKSMVFEKIHANQNLTCIFDDITVDFKPGYKEPLFFSCGRGFKNEIYYILDQKTVTPEQIAACFYASDAIWHSLCVLTSLDINKRDDKLLSLEEINRVCLSADLIITGAYDGEGYVFWEKQTEIHHDF